MDIKVSIIIPVYNVRNRILSTLESLKAQTFKDFEVLFIDDGSPDDSSEFADDYLRDSDVVYRIIKKKNGGVSSARNLGIKEAKGRYIQFLDSDDYIDGRMLEDLYEKAIKTDSDIICSGYVFEESNGVEILNNLTDLKEGEFTGREAALGLIYGVLHTHIMANLFSKTLINSYNIEFDSNRKFAEDIAFEIKAYAHAEKIYCKKKIYSHYVKWEESVTNNISLNFLDMYYSNIETLEYIKKNFKDNEIEKAMIHSRIPRAVINIVAAFAGKTELQNEMYKFIKEPVVRDYLSQYKIYRFKKNELKDFILSKFILYRPNLVERYYRSVKS